MLDKIKESIFQKYKRDEIRWIFFSLFGEKGQLLMSNWVFYTDKSLDELIDTLYHGLIEKHKNISNIVIDMIQDYEEIENIKDIANISTKDFWLLLNTKNKSGILLPDTKWIENIQQAIAIIKKKNWLGWNAQIIKFTTDKFIIF